MGIYCTPCINAGNTHTPHFGSTHRQWCSSPLMCFFYTWNPLWENSALKMKPDSAIWTHWFRKEKNCMFWTNIISVFHWAAVRVQYSRGHVCLFLVQRWMTGKEAIGPRKDRSEQGEVGMQQRSRNVHGSVGEHTFLTKKVKGIPSIKAKAEKNPPLKSWPLVLAILT